MACCSSAVATNARKSRTSTAFAKAQCFPADEPSSGPRGMGAGDVVGIVDSNNGVVGVYQANGNQRFTVSGFDHRFDVFPSFNGCATSVRC